MSCLSINCKRVGALHIECSLVCGTGVTADKYLRVDGDELRWVTPDVAITYNVESNTSWRVE